MLQIPSNMRFELKNAANTLETVASAPKCYKFHQIVAKSMENKGSNSNILQDSWNGSFELQNAANSKENGQKSISKKMPKTE